jgi:hypothetical protein
MLRVSPVASSIEPPLQPKADPSEALWRKKYAGMTDFDRLGRGILSKLGKLNRRD